MLRSVILGLFGFIALGLIIVWVLGGGPQKIYDAVRSASTSTGTSTEKGFALPWQPDGLFPTIETDDLFPPGTIDSNSDAELAALQGEYAGNEQGVDVRTFGDPSPLYGSVRIDSYASSPHEASTDEALTLAAQFTNTAPISLAGWSLQSAVTGIRIPIPHAASPLVAGTVNVTGPAILYPGATALITTGPSPLGGSFRENRCLPYLTQFQSFSPLFDADCPSPETELPISAENIITYGEACIDYVHALPRCTYPDDIPETVSVACRVFVESTFSYNGCVARHRSENSFQSDSWRLYLGSTKEVWGTHDVIRLLDAEGQTVDVYTY